MLNTLRTFLIFLMVSALIYGQDYGQRDETINTTQPGTFTYTEGATLFMDDMNGVNTPAGLQGRGWTVLDVDGGGTTSFFQGNPAVFAAYEGPDTGYSAQNFNGANASGVIDHWLISPEITVSSGDTLRFWHRAPDGNTWDDSIYVRYSTTAGITPADFDQTWGRYLVSETGWAQWVGTFSHTGTIRFAIQYYIFDGGPSGTYSNYIGLDYIEVAGMGGGGGFALPEVLYYLFDETGSSTTTNYAIPGRGTPTATLMGALTMGPTGQFGDALIGAGGSSSANYVDTGWPTDIGASDWTISMWLNNLATGSTTLYYLMGDNTASSFRSFLNGVAGTNNIALRGTGINNVYIGPVAPGPSVVHFVYDSSVPEIRAYINGALVANVAQSALNLVGTGPFKVGGYSSSNSMFAGSLMDEYRFYSRALDDAEIAATWNISVIPVELTSFTASVSGTSVTLDWETATEVNNSGFAIERKSSTSEFQQIGFVAGHGTTTEPMSYSYTDNSLLPDVYSYRLKQIDFDGTYEYSDVVEVEVLTPDEFTLAQNYPNPFNPSTKIAFSLAVDSKVSLTIFNILGQEVTTLISQDLSAGVYNYEFNASTFNSGVYFYKIEAVGVNGTEFVDVKKMMLVK